MKRSLALLVAFLLTTSAGFCAVATYTDPVFLYSIDYPDTWKIQNLSTAAIIKSPRDSELDDFSENVNITAEDLREVGDDVELIDYYRKGMGTAGRMLADFKVLEEAKTVWLEHDAIISLYTMSNKGRRFKCKAYTFMTGKMVYVLTYTATEADFDKMLPTAENIIKSIQVSP